MTKVRFYKNDKGEFLGFQTADHAGYAEYGKDIVCAGISALVINTINSIELLTEDDMVVESDEDRGIIRTKLTGRRSKEGQLLMQSLYLGLTELSKEHDSYLRVSTKEV